MLLADMVRRGEVRLEDSVASHLPLPVGARSGRAIALIDLATHTSGLPFWPSNIPATREGIVSMAAYSVERLYKYLEDFDVPVDVGARWAYSNVDAGVLGLALAHRAGTSYGALLESRITGPLRMTSTTLTPSPEIESRIATGHDAAMKPAPCWNVPALAAAGSLLSRRRHWPSLFAKPSPTWCGTRVPPCAAWLLFSSAARLSSQFRTMDLAGH